MSNVVGEIVLKKEKENLKKRNQKNQLTVFLRDLEDALLCAKRDEHLFLVYVDEGLWRIW